MTEMAWRSGARRKALSKAQSEGENEGSGWQAARRRIERKKKKKKKKKTRRAFMVEAAGFGISPKQQMLLRH